MSPEHEIIARGKQVARVEYGANRLANRPSGKHKRGTLYLTDYSPLCTVTCTDGSSYQFVW